MTCKHHSCRCARAEELAKMGDLRRARQVHNMEVSCRLAPLPIVVNRASHMGTDRDVMIMRPSPLANQYRMPFDGTRDQVCEKHLSEWRWKLKKNPSALDWLRGKYLICCCKPLRCHGDNYVLLLKEREATNAC